MWGHSFTIGGPDPWWVDTELLAAVWLFLVVAPTWLIVAALLIEWWWRERQRIVQRTLTWDLLLWFGLALVFLVAWKRTRPFLVPPKQKVVGAAGSTS